MNVMLMSTVTQVRVQPNNKVRLELLPFKLFSRFCLCSGVPCNLTTRRDFEDILGVISYLLKSGGKKSRKRKREKRERKGERKSRVEERKRGEERRGQRKRVGERRRHNG